MRVVDRFWLKKRTNIARSASGFTLVELLVVMVVVGIMLSIVQVAMTPNPTRVISRDAERLALILSAAQAQSAATGRAMRLEATPGGWRFAQRARAEQAMFDQMGWEIVQSDEVFGPKNFESEGAELTIPPGTGGLGLEPIGAPVSFTLSAGGLTRVIASDGAGQFKMVQPR